jgi:hypothetical protein
MKGLWSVRRSLQGIDGGADIRFGISMLARGGNEPAVNSGLDDVSRHLVRALAGGAASG